MGSNLLGKRQRRRGTFVGTLLYVAPEMLENNESGAYSDLWALGCILFEMANGFSPFVAKTEAAIIDNILNCRYCFPASMPDDSNNSLKDLIRRLLQPDPVERVGLHAFGNLKTDAFFKNIGWSMLEQQMIPPPITLGRPQSKNLLEKCQTNFFKEESTNDTNEKMLSPTSVSGSDGKVAEKPFTAKNNDRTPTDEALSTADSLAKDGSKVNLSDKLSAQIFIHQHKEFCKHSIVKEGPMIHKRWLIFEE